VLALATRDRLMQEVLLEEARHRLDEATRANTVAGPCTPAELRKRDAHLREARRRVDEAARRLGQLAEVERKALDELVRKRQDEEALQTLFDRRRQEHVVEQQASENEFLDEQAISGFHRKRRA
jgi:hypothetical protein